MSMYRNAHMNYFDYSLIAIASFKTLIMTIVRVDVVENKIKIVFLNFVPII